MEKVTLHYSRPFIRGSKGLAQVVRPLQKGPKRLAK